MKESIAMIALLLLTLAPGLLACAGDVDETSTQATEEEAKDVAAEVEDTAIRMCSLEDVQSLGDVGADADPSEDASDAAESNPITCVDLYTPGQLQCTSSNERGMCQVCQNQGYSGQDLLDCVRTLVCL